MLFPITLLVLSCTHILASEVSESAEEPQQHHHVRIPRQHTPPVFNFRTARQQDQQKMRYYQQQKANFLSLTRNIPSNARFPRSNITNSTKITLELLPSAKRKDVHKEVDEKNNKRPVVVRVFGSRTNTTEVTDATQQIKRQDFGNHHIYVTTPRSHQEDEDLDVLNSLLGKHPNAQLEGLQQLLQDPTNKIKVVTTHGPRPFEPKHPLQDQQQQQQQGKLHPDALAQLQAQLDARTQTHVQKALQMAQKQAMVVVEQQHKAMALERQKAEAEAMEKIKVQNDAFEEAYGRKEASNLVASQVPPHGYAYPFASLVQEEPEVAFPHQEGYHVPQQLSEEHLHQANSQEVHAGDEEDVSSTCREYVRKKLHAFKLQYCNHIRKGVRAYGVRNSLKNLILELNCTKFENVQNFFSRKLKDMYKKNRKEFFMLCVLNASEINLQFTHQFDFSNNLTSFNENFMRTKRHVNYEDYYADSYTNYGTNSEFGEVEPSPTSYQQLIAPPPNPHPSKEPPQVIVINNSNHNVVPDFGKLHKRRPKLRRKRPFRRERNYGRRNYKKAFNVERKINVLLSKLERA